MSIKAYKYLSPVIVYVFAFIAFFSKGWLTWLPLMYAWVLLPVIELFISPDDRNMNAAEEEIAKKNKTYDLLLYLFVFLQFAALMTFLVLMKNTSLSWWELAGKIWSMGLLCGIFGINIGHELGHRSSLFEQTLAKASLLTSLYMHFFIEHNKGHHKNVATPTDPSSARFNEPIYFFYLRSVIFSYFSAWKIAGNDMKKKGLPAFHLRNEMILFHIIEILFVVSIFLIFGVKATLFFLIAALIGIALLETVNYIEHYGLERARSEESQYGRVMPCHSWNSNHVLGRIMLFELSRHSDHHYMASKKYQLLRHHDDAPQLPTGYPGSMILALFPPVWFYIMNRRIKKVKGHLFAG